MQRCSKCGSPKLVTSKKGDSIWYIRIVCLNCGEETPLSRENLLSLREWQCIDLAKSGKKDRAIGKDLKISYQTVKNHLYSARKKLKANDRTHLVYICMKGGIID